METRLKCRIRLTLEIISGISRNFGRKVILVKGSRFEAVSCDITPAGIGFFIPYYLPRGVNIEMAARDRPFSQKKHGSERRNTLLQFCPVLSIQMRYQVHRYAGKPQKDPDKVFLCGR